MINQEFSAGFDYCYPIMAPQTEIPLTGEMSRSDKRVTARYEQLEPVTLNMLSATAVASLYRYDKTIHRIVLSATDNSRITLLRCDVAGERTVQRCRQKQKDRTSCDLFMCLCNGNQTVLFQIFKRPILLLQAFWQCFSAEY